MQRHFSYRICTLCSRTSLLSKRDYHNQSPTLTRLGYQKSRFLVPVNQPVVTLDFQCHLSVSSKWNNDNKDDKIDFSKDPEVKKWLSDLQSDFANELGKKDEEEKEENIEKDEKSVHPTKFSVDKQSVGMQANAETQSKTSWTQYASQKYEKFSQEKSQIIYDYDEEVRRLEEGIEEEETKIEEMVLKRGKTGVFDIEELVDYLREENARDIVVIQVPPEIKYVSYIVIVSSMSQRHINALAETTRRIYKKKKSKKDPSIVCEGKSTNWVALDMGNIALHIMKPDIREDYDLETLWTVGAQFDDKCQAVDDSPIGMLDSFGHFTEKNEPPELRP